MKRLFYMVCSICLVLAGLFGLLTGVSGIQDAKNLQDYKTEDSEDGLAAVDVLLDGIAQLRENEDTYVAGVDTYEAGLISYSEGKSTLSAGYKEYYAGKQTLEEGKKAYAEGQKTLEEGKKAYEEGKQKIADNTQAYNEGKEKFAKIEPLLPYLNQYVQFRDGTIAKLPGFSTAQAWFVSVVRPLASQLGLDIPEDVTDFPAYINQMVADGKAQLKEYEDGVVALEEAEKTIAAGEEKLAAAAKEIEEGEEKLADAEKQLAQGEIDLAAGGQELADGKEKLAEFENGAAQIAAGLETLLAEEENVTGTYYFDEGSSDEIACPSIKAILQERYGEDWTYWMTDDNGEIVVKNGCQYLDFDACEQAAIAAQDYINAYQGDPDISGDTIERIFYCIGHSDGNITYTNLGHEITMPCNQCETVIREVIARYIVSVLELIASVLAIVSGVLGIVFFAARRGASGTVCGWVTVGFGLAATVFGFCASFTSYIYPVALYSGDARTSYEFSSHTQAPVLVALTVLAVIFSLLASAVKKDEKQRVAAAASAVEDSSEFSEPVNAESVDDQIIEPAKDSSEEMTVKEE
jgi:hypothetical protein